MVSRDWTHIMRLAQVFSQQSCLHGSTSPFVSSFSAGKTGAILFRLHHEPENDFAIWQGHLTDISWTPPLLPGKQQVLLWLLIPLRSASKGLWSPDTYHEGALRDKAIVHGDSYANKPLVFWTGERGQEFSMFPLMCRAAELCLWTAPMSRLQAERDKLVFQWNEAYVDH